MNIPVEILRKYETLTLEEYKTIFGDSVATEKMFYKNFLQQTDHIPNKIIEAQMLGEIPEDYSEILKYRQLAREKINELNELQVNELGICE